MKLSINRIVLAIIYLLTILFFIFIISTNMIPLKFLIGIFVVLLLFDVGLFFLLFKKKKKKNIIGYIIGGFLVIILFALFYYLNITLGFFKGFGSNKYKEENYLVLVLQDSNFQKITDLTNIGYTSNELSNINEALTKLNEEISIENKEYENNALLFDSLINKEIDSVLIEES